VQGRKRKRGLDNVLDNVPGKSTGVRGETERRQKFQKIRNFPMESLIGDRKATI